MQKKIFIGTTNVGNNTVTLAQGFRELGFEVGTADIDKHNKFYDLNLDFHLAGFQNSFKRILDAEKYLKNLSRSYQKLLDYDIYIFMASNSLLPGMLDIPVLKKMGKTVISLPLGSDIRHHESAKTFNAQYGHDYPQQLISDQRNTENKIISLALKGSYAPTYSKKLYNTRIAENYADVMLSAPCSNMLGVRPYIAGLLPFDSSIYTPKVCRRDKPVIFHAPTSRAFKGTDIILETLEQLEREGIPFDFFLAENIPNKEVLKALTECDIVIDQIACGKSGLFGLEAMASGCALLGCNDEYAQPFPFEAHPTIRITKENLYNELKTLLTNKSLRIQKAEQGIEYINKQLHTPKNVARYTLKAITRAAQGNYDYYPTFYFEHTTPPHGEVVPDHLLSLTSSLLQQYGTSEELLKGDLLRKQLGKFLSEGNIKKIPTWDTTSKVRCSWGWWDKKSTDKND
ncbi:hypothetical protein [Maridesulfovibrio sp.]|uniref:hypothetical protein n=1 Tax=Maridesulfovibrio sp. TaxID=2795000 RepID=UPI003BAC4006